MKDLQVSGGDIVLAGSNLALVDGAAYIRQRIATALAEPYGSDPFNPAWGSTLYSYIGLPYVMGADALAASEVARVLAQIIAAQRQMITSWALTGTKAQLLAADTIASVDSITAQPGANADTMSIYITLTTAGGQQLAITRTVA